MDLEKMIKIDIEKNNQLAKGLSTETKRAFWRAFYDEERTLGEARERAGIDDVGVAIALIIQCYKIRHIPMEVAEVE